MFRKKWKMNPDAYWRIGEYENWFRHQSKKGYHLTKLNTLMSTFQKGDKQDIQYRIELATGSNISLEQIQLYEDAGWTYIDSSKVFHVFSSPTEKKAVEIYSDPVEQAYTLSKLKKDMKRAVIASVLGTSFMIFFAVIATFLNNSPVLAFIEGTGLSYLTFSFTFLVGALLNIKIYLGLKKLTKQLEAGISINHEAPWRKAFFIHKGIIYTLLSVMAILFVSLIVQLNKMETYTLPSDTSDLPILKLVELETPQKVEQGEPMIIEDIDYTNYYSINWNFLTPVQLDSTQTAFLKDSSSPDFSGLLTLNQQYYEVRFSFLAEPLVKELMDSYHTYAAREQFELASSKYFEKLYIYEDESMPQFKEIIGIIGKQVIHIQYTGDKKTDALINQTGTFFSQ